MQETADILKISKSIKSLVKMKDVSFILWKKLNRLFGQSNNSSFHPHQFPVNFTKIINIAVCVGGGIYQICSQILYVTVFPDTPGFNILNHLKLVVTCIDQ